MQKVFEIDLLNEELHLPQQRTFIGARTQVLILKILNYQAVERHSILCENSYQSVYSGFISE